LHEEAAKIYRRILQNEPDNLEARKNSWMWKNYWSFFCPDSCSAKPAELPRLLPPLKLKPNIHREKKIRVAKKSQIG